MTKEQPNEFLVAEKKHKELLFEFGFVKDGDLKKLTVAERKKKLMKASEEEKKHYLSPDMLEQELLETADAYFEYTDYPDSQAYQRLVWETVHSNLEEIYYWIFEHLRQDRAFHKIIKITDMYAASEASAFWGNQQQRIGAQQSNVQGLLANIGKFVKELFQMVRELRIIDERLDMYEGWEKKDPKTGKITRSDSADVTLKSLFTDQVEGGTKNPQSVFGLAQTVGFSLLPDLFFNTRVYSEEELDKKVAQLDINESNRNVLKRKLYQFIIWKQRTHVELKNRRAFNIRYLRQHWTIIKTYMNWAKPYLKNLQRLQMNQLALDSPEIVSSFDTNMSEIELLAMRKPINGVFPVVVANIQARSRPDMNIRKEYQQGPTHLGRTQIALRAFAWTQKQIDNYRAMRAKEGIELLGVLDSQLAAVMEGLGTEFQEYLSEMEESIAEPDDEKKKESPTKKAWGDAKNTLDPFLSIFLGFAEIIEPFIPNVKLGGKKHDHGPSEDDFEEAASIARTQLGMVHHIFKKNKKMLTW